MPQPWRQFAIDLDGYQPPCASGKNFGDGSGSGTNLDDGLVGKVAERISDLVAGACVDKKILPKFGFLLQAVLLCCVAAGRSSG
jgi:hypothetical protein